MRIKIVTFFSSHNVGAMLQAYGLQHFLKKKINHVEILNYEDHQPKIFYKARNIQTFMRNIIGLIYYKQLKVGYNRFESFLNDELWLTEAYNEFDELYQYNDADLMIVGSDQVWNPLNFRPIYFLDFVSNNTVKASYAASMGVSYVPEEIESKYYSLLNQMDFISVRESNAKEILSKKTNLEINVNLDPTFLLSVNEWRKLQNSLDINQPFIFCYILYNPPWLNEYLKKLKNETGFNIVLINNSGLRPVFNDICVRDAGPKEFLWLIDNAEIVVSSSFHGNVFSIIYEKEFYAVINPKSNSRIKNILDICNLQDREVTTANSERIMLIDFDRVKKRINTEISRSDKYLDNIILSSKGTDYEC